MLGTRNSLRSSNPNSTRFRLSTCTLTRTRSSYRYGYRPCCRNDSCASARNSVCSRPRNSVRSGPRSSSRNSRRSCFCNGIQPCARSFFPSLLPRWLDSGPGTPNIPTDARPNPAKPDDSAAADVRWVPDDK